jgi:hypothetical protein
VGVSAVFGRLEIDSCKALTLVSFIRLSTE